MSDDKVPFGIIPLTAEMLRPEGPLATALRENSASAMDAPPVREGDGWTGRLEGFCPLQGYGNVDGKHWYFRARWDHWSFEVWDEPFGADGELPVKDPVWMFEAAYGEAEGDASWMPFSDAWRFIESSIAAFRNWPVCAKTAP